MKKAHSCLVPCLCLLAFSLSTLWAEPAQPPSVPTRVKRVALFKNGLAFFVREAALSSDRTVTLLGPFATPSHGTFWVSCPSRAGLESVLCRHVTVPEEIPAREVAELLRANVGKQVAIWLTSEPEPAIVGTVLDFAPDRAPEQPGPYIIGGRARPGHVAPPGRGQFVLIQTDDGVVALDPYRLVTVRFMDDEIERHLIHEKKEVVLEASFRSPEKGDWLSVSHLAKGLTWAPSYFIDISDSKEARLSAKALVINEAEDLDDVHVDLITGFPNLQFADVLSPIGKKEGLASFLQSLSRGRSRREEAAVVTQNVALWEADVMARSAAPVPDYGAAVAGQVAEDLFLYPLENVALAKDETGYYPLFTESVPYTEIYQWEIPDYVNEQDRYGVRNREERDKPEEVWHSIRLTNTTELPWTTAPAQLIKDGHIIGQDTLSYTPPKGTSTVKITQAVSIKAEQNEVEVEREREALRMYGSYFDRVTIEGTLQVTNYKDKLVTLEIRKTLSGEFEGTSHTAQETVLARGLRRMNPVRDLVWTIDLKPGESKEITYTYKALIRR